MVEKGYEVVWTKQSQKQMRQVFRHISKDSPKNASKVVIEIAEAVTGRWKNIITGWLIVSPRT
jgi:plasmid stabilization system protein ParE